MQTTIVTTSLLSMILLAFAYSVSAAESPDPQPHSITSSDGQLVETEPQSEDITEADEPLPDRKFAAFPVPITDDALGVGLGVNAMYLHDRAEGAKNPSTSMFYGQYTDSGSGMAIIGHEHVFAYDAWRAGFWAGHFGLNLKYTGRVGMQLPKAAQYSSYSNFVYGEVRKELVDNLYFGVQGLWSGGDAELKENATAEEKKEFERQMSGHNGAVGLLMTYDSRDNMLGATQGLNLDLSTLHYSKDSRTGKRFDRYDAEMSQYFPVGDDVFAYRVIGKEIVGDAPENEFVTPDLRGVDWNKYRGTSTYQAEIEYRHKFSTLWSGVAFAGAAIVENEDRHLSNSVKSEVIPSAGVGVRYLLNAKERFSIGADVAVSKMGNTSFYIRFGEAF
ncbi:hypothetical protein BCU70_18695 [Vibrio sp. 10N.286.49.C2]|uniref:hypothetical protein n=1 Tax=unclassified Vibrio TaxID=2614977 RepID=UPI000C82AED4|nr:MULTISPECIES: hypothetical protein [unclassified Vibrio]PMH35174.1 hypothetical protein BCU70_18695 [Vibrio sp. 10N.286.49.C2]PMH57117.1 hypothetical protein BCU66_06395 [Vibrio sp. 10N.286.49.B1]PMH83587.1 hypothetical protein BCU58_14185 [Vibrio sp. 10N.286.48.B7]